MKFTFKTLPYQNDAVQSIINVFDGQEYNDGIRHLHDLGNSTVRQTVISDERSYLSDDDRAAFRNNDISIPPETMLENVRKVQQDNGLDQSNAIMKPLGAITLDIDMETGTGKTYVYTKTMFELNKVYGWSKFIVIVPSIAIREGVLKNIQTTTDHFMEMYGKKLRAFIYDSSNLSKIDDFSQNSGINVMIINSQAFATSLKEGAKNKESRIIYSKRDEFASRRPIDIIAANRPILILDEPQKLNGNATQEALRKHFNVLFSMNFSATHVVNHNKIYSLDALDAYNQKLVKKIEVKGLDIRYISGTDPYIYFESIVLNGKEKPKARIELFVNHASGVKKETHIVGYKDNLYSTSSGSAGTGIEAYKNLFVTDIDGIKNIIELSNGVVLHAGDSIGDVTELDKRRIQIRETILSHLDKENRLYKKGIKVLSLFFIDEVANYRQYDENGNPVLGEYGKVFEEEFNNILQSRGVFYDPDYIQILKKHPVGEIHAGYFSIDPKGHVINSKEKRGSDQSDDVSAYDRILKHKELLLSESDPIRFIFSHSALSEGWDNPNVFQICALKHSSSTTRRRQEVGRGMRICVDQNGDRQDFDVLGPLFHDYNLLTVVADEDYETFVKGLQTETLEDIRDRVVPIDLDFLTGRKIFEESGTFVLDAPTAKKLHNFFIASGYLDLGDMPTERLRTCLRNDDLAQLPPDLADHSSGIKKLLWEIADPASVNDMFADGRRPKIKTNRLNDNFKKKEFIKLWDEINHMYHYKVSFDSEELIRAAVGHINKELEVTGLSYTVKTGAQRNELTYEQARSKNGFDDEKTREENVDAGSYTGVKYDLIGSIASGTKLTRKTVAAILYRIDDRKFNMFKANPEEFITKTTRLINEKKATAIVDHIVYKPTEQKFDNDIFTMNRPEGEFIKAYQAKKNVQDYIFPDSDIERAFAKDLDGAEEVVVYAKLPDGKGGFYIPTPVGDYTPDWAIAFSKDKTRHIYFVAETKGSMSSMNLDKIEEAKINCATKLFEEMGNKVEFRKIDNFANLMSIIKTD